MADEREAGLADGIGRRLAAHRGQRGMRVAELAREIGVSPSLISQIERGQSRPSVSTLFAMAQALGVPVDAFFREPAQGAASGSAVAPSPGTPEPEPRPAAAPCGPPREASAPARTVRESRYVVRAGERAAIDIEGGVRWERLTPQTLPHLDFFQLVYGPHAASHPTPYTHPGTEVVLVTSGVLDITVGFDRYRLHPGDSMQLPSTIPHRYVNPVGETARAVTVILYDCPEPDGPMRLPLPPHAASVSAPQSATSPGGAT